VRKPDPRKVCQVKQLPPKRRKCQCGCRQQATGGNGVTAWASIDCAIKIAAARREKAEKKAQQEDRKATRAAKEKLKTRRDYIKEAQIAFNAYIRERDKDKPCICCGEPLLLDAIGGGFDCGHYRSVGSAPFLRFDERNAHGQRKKCNRYGAGRAVDYRIGLINRIGADAVERVEADQTVRKWTIEDLKRIRDDYREKVKALRKAAENFL
jgi:hypothetical protein